LLARQAPTIVARDRVKGAERAVAHGAGAIVMDDGFQSPGLAKTLCIVAIDAEVGVGNGWVAPSGPLRARLSYQISRADALVLIGSGAAGNSVAEMMADQGKPIFHAVYTPAAKTDWLKKQPVIAFAGIARPSKFFSGLERLGAHIAESVPFPDHHVFNADDAGRLLDLAKAKRSQLVTTEKDLARLKGPQPHQRALCKAARALPIVLKFENERAYSDLLAKALASKSV
jgi:tetraacyldisaccharide 4'-kinase